MEGWERTETKVQKSRQVGIYLKKSRQKVWKYGVLCATFVLQRCYTKIMATKRKTTRTSPTGIRFDIEKLSFISERENLETKQQVVDFLMENYWWDKKSEDKALSAPIKHIPPSKREVVEQVVKDFTKPTNQIKPQEQPKSNFTIDTRPQKPQELSTFMQKRQQMKNGGK